MSANPPVDHAAIDQGFARLWADSTVHVLERVAGSPFTSTPRSPESADDATGDAFWARFKSSGRLTGELALRIAPPDAVRLTQLLMSEPLDASVTFDESRTDALNEILRQFAGVASTACTSRFGGEVQFDLGTNTAPEWQTAAESAWIFAAPKVDPLQWTLALSAELHATLEAQLPPEATQKSAEMPRGDQLHEDARAASAPMPAKLDLLLDVELEASLRFGQREMLLRDILELHPGSVIELDRRVQEPAELIVAGRIIAHGEVVIVDGNYGLRITDIAQASQRLQSLET